MWGFRESARPASAKGLGKALVATWLLGALGWCVVTPESRLVSHPPKLAQSEEILRRLPAHISEFSPVSEPLALPKCSNVRQPEALLTPDPLLQNRDEGLTVRVSFIIGSDGHVYSPFILDSASPEEDLMVLRAVRLWRYRPALCNGVPADSEARIRFIVH
jgi:TonB family protein